MGAEGFPKTLVAALAEQIRVHVADGGQMTVGVIGNDYRAILVFGAHTVIGNPESRIGFDALDDGTEHAIVLMLGFGFAVLGDDRHGFRQRTQHTDRNDIRMLAGTEVPAEHFVWVVVRTVAYCIQVALIHRNGNDIFIDLGFCNHGKSVSTKRRKMAPCRA